MEKLNFQIKVLYVEQHYILEL